MRAATFVGILTLLGMIACKRPAEGGREARTPGDEIVATRPDTAHGVVFPEARVASLLDQCSRPTPHDVVGYWTPTSAEIVALEARLPRALKTALSRAAPEFSKRVRPDDYYRQYGGVVHRDGRRTVYVNGFLQTHSEVVSRIRAENSDHPERLSEFPPEFRSSEWWRDISAKVCDGGEAYFGVEYDPAARTFDAIAFNGHA